MEFFWSKKNPKCQKPAQAFFNASRRRLNGNPFSIGSYLGVGKGPNQKYQIVLSYGADQSRIALQNRAILGPVSCHIACSPRWVPVPRQGVSCMESRISPSSEGAERGGKFEAQQKILSLTATTISGRFHAVPKPLH